ncbi:hypothetical protein GYA13_03095 [Candidatus Kuenenbacteria bacterium]|nr:hypothetical protein [Candidatus Kuenenbacteria bacterium]
MKTKIIAIFFVILAITPLFLGWPTWAEENNELETAQAEKSQLEAELADIEAQINDYQNQLKTIKGEKSTLQNKIKQLQTQQSAVNLQIKATNLKIDQIEKDLGETREQIDDKTERAERLQGQIAEILRAINRSDHYSIVYLLAASENLSEAFDEIEQYAQLSSGLKDLLTETKEIKKQLAIEAEILEDKQTEAKDLLSIKVLQKQQLTGLVGEQNTLLKETKGKEANYQNILSDAQKKAAEIRNRLYQLLGVSQNITFGQAVEIATWASGQTGVRAAFLLAVLTQESNLGKNVGTCNRAGDPPEKSWRVVMKPTRDHEPFKTITTELGMDIDTTPVSCPMRDSKGKQIGWGGAMGPAQFIPSTWMGYKSKIEAITGKTANPWDIRDAFIAAAIKLKADGAGTKSGEWTAAMKYFSGGTNTKYRFYGDNVVATADKYQEDIDALNK